MTLMKVLVPLDRLHRSPAPVTQAALGLDFHRPQTPRFLNMGHDGYDGKSSEVGEEACLGNLVSRTVGLTTLFSDQTQFRSVNLAMTRIR